MATKTKERELTYKEKAFVKEFTKDLNGTEAVKRAYKTTNSNSAGVTAHRKLRKAKIKQGIEAALQKAGITKESLTSRLQELIYVEDQRTALQAVRTGLELQDAFPKKKTEVTNITEENLADLTPEELETKTNDLLDKLNKLRTNHP